MSRTGVLRAGFGLVATVALSTSACEPVLTSVGSWSPDPNLYIEAESGELVGGFTIADDVSASGGRYIAPLVETMSDTEAGPARARYAFSIANDGQYVIWGRIQSPSALNNRFWIQVDGGTWFKWRISVGEIWFWDDVHDDTDYDTPLTFPLVGGAHELVVANAVDGVGLDRLYLSATGDIPPGNDTPCNPPHSIQIGAECLPSCGSLNGTACGVVECEGRPPLPAYDCDVCCRIAP